MFDLAGRRGARAHDTLRVIMGTERKSHGAASTVAHTRAEAAYTAPTIGYRNKDLAKKLAKELHEAYPGQHFTVQKHRRYVVEWLDGPTNEEVAAIAQRVGLHPCEVTREISGAWRAELMTEIEEALGEPCDNNHFYPVSVAEDGEGGHLFKDHGPGLFLESLIIGLARQRKRAHSMARTRAQSAEEAKRQQLKRRNQEEQWYAYKQSPRRTVYLYAREGEPEAKELAELSERSPLLQPCEPKRRAGQRHTGSRQWVASAAESQCLIPYANYREWTTEIRESVEEEAAARVRAERVAAAQRSITERLAESVTF